MRKHPILRVTHLNLGFETRPVTPAERIFQIESFSCNRKSCPITTVPVTRLGTQKSLILFHWEDEIYRTNSSRSILNNNLILIYRSICKLPAREGNDGTSKQKRNGKSHRKTRSTKPSCFGPTVFLLLGIGTKTVFVGRCGVPDFWQ